MKNLFSDWKLFEKIWLVTFLGIIIVTGFVFGDTWLGFTASITGVITVILVAKGKISNYLFGFINALVYAYIAFSAGLYGESMLNALFYVPIQIIGFYMWSKNMNKNELGKSVVKPKSLTKKGWLYVVGVVLVVGVAYGLFLQGIDSKQAGVDAFAVVLSITAQLLMIKRYTEQWLLWIVVNVLTIILWLNIFIQDGNSVTILVMWCAFLVNSIYAYYNWKKLEKVVTA